MDHSLDRKLRGFQLVAQEKLQAIICSIPGKKDLILEPKLIKPLEHVCSASWLKLKGIQHIYKFDADTLNPRRGDSVHVYIISSQLETFAKVLTQIHELEAKLPTDTNAAIKHFHIICVPSCFVYFLTILEDEGLFGLVQLHSFSWDLLYLDSGVMSMEISNTFSNVFLRDDSSLLPSIARTLRILQMICGRPELIVSYGEHSANVMKMLKALGTSPASTSADNNNSDFAAMIVIDRDMDYVSSLLTPAIYAGLLLEVFSNHVGEINIEENKILDQKLKLFALPKNKAIEKATTATSRATKSISKALIRLNSLADEIYGENRYKHFSEASSLVRAQAKAIGLEVQKLSDMKLHEMNDYVARKLPKITELKTKIMRHLNASEKVIQMLAGNFQRLQSLEEDILNNTSRKKLLQEIDELLTTDGQRYNTLRLLCLLHLSAGLSSDELSQFVRNYCNYFGSQHLPMFNKLAKAGLLPTLEEEKPIKTSAKILSNLPIPKFQQTEFQANANRLKLLVSSSSGNEVDANNSHDSASKPSPSSATEKVTTGPSYVFNGLYIPLIAKLCSMLIKTNTTDELAAKLNMIDKLQIHTSDQLNTVYDIKSFASAVKKAELKNVFPLHKRNIFVFVVGGVTYAEIGACELVGRYTGSQIVVASDSIVSGSDIIAAAF